MGQAPRKILLLLLPALLTPAWGFLIAEGIINFGGGEKDILILLPYLIWWLIYLIIGSILWKQPLRKMFKLALLYSFTILLVLWLGLVAYGSIITR